jgi:hypothetical protein
MIGTRRVIFVVSIGKGRGRLSQRKYFLSDDGFQPSYEAIFVVVQVPLSIIYGAAHTLARLALLYQYSEV